MNAQIAHLSGHDTCLIIEGWVQKTRLVQKSIAADMKADPGISPRAVPVASISLQFA